MDEEESPGVSMPVERERIMNQSVLGLGPEHTDSGHGVDIDRKPLTISEIPHEPEVPEAVLGRDEPLKVKIPVSYSFTSLAAQESCDVALPCPSNLSGVWG